MDFFKKQATSFLSKSDEEAPKKSAPAAAEGAKKDAAPSYSELMGSANILMEAAKGQFGGAGGAAEGGAKGKMDTAKVAGAAEDLLEGAQHYGKLDESSAAGGYLKKAEDYLHSYNSRELDVTAAPTEATAPETTHPKDAAAPATTDPKDAAAPAAPATDPKAPAPPAAVAAAAAVAEDVVAEAKKSEEEEDKAPPA